MAPKILRSAQAKWFLFFAALAGGYACSKEGDSGNPSGSSGSSCQAAGDCKSGVCSAGICYGNGQLAPAKAPCTVSSQCASGSCTDGVCASGTALPNGFSCAAASECKSGLCTSGVCGSSASTGSGGSSGGFGVVTAANPPFQGLGDNWRPLTPGCGPDTAKQCAGACEAAPDSTATVIRPPALLCFGADDAQTLLDPTPDTPAAIIEQVIETLDGQSYVHIRVTFDPAFADNTFGANASAGWFATSDGKTGKGHTFVDDLTGSDHLQLQLTDASGATVMSFKEDYITSLTDTGKPKPGGPGGPGGPGAPGAGGATSTATTATTTATGCGYASLGVLGGDGAMLTGDSSDILAVATSIERNVGGCGYCASSACSAGTTGTGDGDCTTNSPLTDANYTPSTATPNWNYNVVYEVWVKLSAFGTTGFGQAYITSVHASPSKLSGNTLLVVPEPCPPGWGTCAAGQNCAFAPPPGSGGSGGGGGTTGTGEGPCKPNYQMYITQEGGTECTPIPFAGYPGMAACPTGYHLDTASEGQFCLQD